MHDARPAARPDRVGPDGLPELQRLLPCRAAAPAGFHARVRGAELGRLQVVDWRSTAVQGRTPRTPGTLGIMLILEGAVRFHTAGSVQDALPGRFHLQDGDLDCDWRVPRGVHAHLLRLPRSLLRASDGTLAAPAPGLLDHHDRLPVLARGFRALVELAVEDRVSPHVGESLRHLALTMLDAREASPADGTRDRISRYIDGHLSDPGLTPARIASACNLSLRAAHYAFAGGESLARSIRTRRLDAVAHAVRADPSTAGSRSLAGSHGFNGRDQLARAFRERYRLTLGEFAAEVAAGGDPRPAV